ncbi:uncharacterized protein Z519_01230 [Cladophialophora bantiana CBS 173.52]|uniref:Bacteriophage T5 Orf172 DNA-binding domain-containing protein n=1 Tax=Cladophialophora bantiana (strain ATCC 10958 / CBS 173.52 / CDC B-1940 / NIH 8579) TaxID=1442370 RepID=A0A0D2F620_CLAB1|nr:uncharacterized protein Z519_01230 [Cladophialophora bantiana CBS 173.52]KIW97646.1 hypothetical protein Z519_01230 [Cladophialophora bantiana CBS 173.52]
MSFFIYGTLLLSFLLSASLNYYLWPELLTKLGSQFFPDFERSIKIFHTSDPDFKCIHLLQKQKRRCKGSIITTARRFATLLREVLLVARWDDPQTHKMLYMYSQLCHCPIHQIAEENVTAMYKRWEIELKDTSLRSSFSTFIAYKLLRHRIAGHFPVEDEDEDEDEDEPSEIEHSAESHASGLQSPEMYPQNKRFTPTRNLQCRNPAASQQPSPAFANGDDASNFRRYWAGSEKGSLYLTITKRLDPDELKSGFIYILIHPTLEHYVKIGYSTELEKPEYRLEEWKASCNLKYRLHKSYTTRYAKRVESLVFSDLCKHRYELRCGPCRKVHNEWFYIGSENAERVVNYWVDWIATLAPYRGLKLKRDFVRAMFDVVAQPEDQNVVTGRMGRFLYDSSNNTWVDHSILLGIRSRKSTPPADTTQAAKAIRAEDPSMNTPTLLQNRVSDALSEPERTHRKPTHTTTPKETTNRVVKSPEAALLPTSPDSKPGLVRRRLFSSTSSAQATASSSPPPSRANMPPPRSLPTSLRPSPASLSENVRDAEDTPSKSRTTRERGSETKATQRRKGAKSSKMPVHDPCSPEVRLCMPPDNGMDQETSGSKAAQDNSNNQIDEMMVSDGVLSPLQLPSPRVESESCLVSDAMESKLPRGTPDRQTVHTPAQSAANLPLRFREVIDLTLEDKVNSDDEDIRRASAPQILHTPPDSGSKKRKKSSRRSTSGKRISIGDTVEQ